MASFKAYNKHQLLANYSQANRRELFRKPKYNKHNNSTNMLIQATMDWEQWSHKPSAETPYPKSLLSEAAIISSRIAEQMWTGTQSEFAEAIGHGQTWCARFHLCPERRKYRRIARLWAGQQAFGVDLDHPELTANAESLIAESIAKLGVAPAIVHTSFSHKVDAPKYRLIYFTQQLVTEPTLALRILRHLAITFEGDPAVCDIARLFYGGKSGSVVHQAETWFPPKLIATIAETTLPTEAKTKPWSPSIEQYSVKPSAREKARRKGLIMHAFSLLLDPVAKCGSGYQAIFSATTMLAREPWIRPEYIAEVVERAIIAAPTIWAESRWRSAEAYMIIIEHAMAWRYEQMAAERQASAEQ